MEDTPKQNDQKKEIEISILKGDKLFNENTPFVINLLAPETKEQEEKRVSADLICVIDISGSMCGEKISLVKESLKILVDMMDPKDRIALVLFESQAKLLYDINYLTPENKSKIKDLINNINASGGTNIASGLEIAVEILKKQKENKTIEEGRSSSIILLSDGQDNNMDDTQLGDKLKSLTKGEGLSFTLNTFGYGYDHDPKIMNKLANLRDGSFFVVEDYNKVGEYFVTVLGGCISMISKNAELNVKLMNDKCKIIKIFGGSNLYSYELKDCLFTTQMLQFIQGKEYTFVLEIKIDESNIKPGDNLLDVNFIYDDISKKEKITINAKYNYELKDLNFAKANEEYIRSQTYDVIEKALKLRDNDEIEEGKKELKKMRDWLEKNYKGDNKAYLEDIKKSEQLFEYEHYEQRDYTYTTSLVRQMQNKRIGSSSMNYSNKAQTKLQNAYIANYSKSQNNNNFNNNIKKKRNSLDDIDEIEDDKDNDKDIYKTDIKMNRSKTNNSKNKKCYII